MTLPAAFQSPSAFRDAFETGLVDMLARHDGLGVFILVLANAAIDPALRTRLDAALHARFAALCAAPPDAAPDDAAVFAALRELGIERVEPVQRRVLAPFEVQYNPLRALRPARNAGRRIETLRQAFDADGFHFAKPFLQKEVFWRGALLGHEVELLYNKFPFLPLHGLLVPEARAGHAQYLTRDWHAYVWEVAARLGATVPGAGIGYNALGANASVNHLHFQLFVRDEPLPVDTPHWAHNGGAAAYPSGCARFTDADAAWACIDALHAANRSYNLIYRPGVLYCLPRRFQGTAAGAPWAEGHAFYELAGGLTVTRGADFDALDAAQLAVELERLAVP